LRSQDNIFIIVLIREAGELLLLLNIIYIYILYPLGRDTPPCLIVCLKISSNYEVKVGILEMQRYDKMQHEMIKSDPVALE
jgi:hypothetical protein